MSEQDFSMQEQGDDYAREPEPDAYTLRENEHRSGYFLAAICFLIALLCLAAILNHVSLNPTLLQFGALIFGAMGIFFILRSRATTPHTNDPKSLPHEDAHNHMFFSRVETDADADNNEDESEDR